MGNECPEQPDVFGAKGLGPDDLLQGRRGCLRQGLGWKVREASGVCVGATWLWSGTSSCGYPLGKLQGETRTVEHEEKVHGAVAEHLGEVVCLVLPGPCSETSPWLASPGKDPGPF